MTKPRGRKWGSQPLGLVTALLGGQALETLLQVGVLQKGEAGPFLELSAFG